MKFKIQSEAWKRDDNRVINNVTETQIIKYHSFSLTYTQILRQMKERNLTLPRIISFDYKRPLMKFILTCTEHKSTN